VPKQRNGTINTFEFDAYSFFEFGYPAKSGLYFLGGIWRRGWERATKVQHFG
jgi:hypothetical protein